MKITLWMIAILLLVSSCGLFKKTSKSRASSETVITEKISENLQVEQDTGEIQIIQLNGGTLIKDEHIIQIEGEEIQITKEGVIQLRKGKIYQKKNQYAETLQVEEQFHSDWKDQKIKSSQQSENKIELRKEQSKVTARPAVTSLFYFIIGFGVLIVLVIWWLKKSKFAPHW